MIGNPSISFYVQIQQNLFTNIIVLDTDLWFIILTSIATSFQQKNGDTISNISLHSSSFSFVLAFLGFSSMYTSPSFNHLVLDSNIKLSSASSFITLASTLFNQNICLEYFYLFTVWIWSSRRSNSTIISVSVGN